MTAETTYTEKSWKSVPCYVSCPIRIKLSPSLLESTDLFSTDDRQAAASLVHVTETFVDQRDEQVDKDVHAENVPGDEKSACPFRATAVALKVPRSNGAERFVYVCKVFHQLIPPFAHAHSEQEDKSFGNGTEVDVARLIRPETSETEGLCERNRIHQK